MKNHKIMPKIHKITKSKSKSQGVAPLAQCQVRFGIRVARLFLLQVAKKQSWAQRRYFFPTDSGSAAVILAE